MRLRSVSASLALHGLALGGLGLLGNPAASTTPAPTVDIIVLAEPPPVEVAATVLAPEVGRPAAPNPVSLGPRRPVSRRHIPMAAPVAQMTKESVVEESPAAVPVAPDSPPGTAAVAEAAPPAPVAPPPSTPPGAGSGAGAPRPRLLPPGVAEGQLLIDPQDERYRPIIPPALRRAGVRATPLLKVCVSEAGTVQSVTVLQPSDAVLDPLIVAKVKTYLFRPSLHEGRPVPFCYARQFRLSVE